MSSRSQQNSCQYDSKDVCQKQDLFAGLPAEQITAAVTHHRALQIYLYVQ